MTLGIGNHVLKVDPATKEPPTNEIHIEFEVEGFGTSFVFNDEAGAPAAVNETLGDKGFFTGWGPNPDEQEVPPRRVPFVRGEQYQVVLLRKVR